MATFGDLATESLHRETVKATVTDVGEVTKLFGSVKFVPERIEVTYERVDDGPWKVARLVLVGRRRTKDGKPGKDVLTSDYGSWVGQEAPEWAKEFANTQHPEVTS